MSLQVEVAQQRDAVIIRLSGELDHHSANELRNTMEQAILKGRCQHLILNMEKLDFMDSSGLGVILGRYKFITGRGGKMVVCQVNSSLYRLFEMSGLFKIITIEENESRALSSLGVVS